MGEIMSIAKEKLIEVINDQPDDSSSDEILRELAFNQMIERGLYDSDNKRVISNQEMEHRIQTWSK